MSEVNRSPKPSITCCVCGNEDRRFECYALSYRLAGWEEPRRYNICAACWAEGKWKQVTDRIGKLGHGTKESNITHA